MSQDLLTLARFAEVLAHQEHYGDGDAAEVRERLDVASVWEASFAHWTDKIEDDAVREESQLSQEFAESFGATSSMLEEKKPPIESLGKFEEQQDLAEAPPEVEAPGDELPSVPPPVEAHSVVAATAEHPPVISPPPKTGASPWAKGVPAAPAVVAPPPPVAPVASEAAAAQASIDQTAFVSALIVEDPLPFTDAPAQPPAPAVASDSIDEMGMTAEVPAILTGNETLPFTEASAFGIDEEILDKLTIEQYASLCAELEAKPQERAGALRRYGVDDNTFEILESAWTEHLQSDPAALQRFNQLLDSYRAWLSRHR